MASGSSFTEVEEEARCPICLECLEEPVTLDCGHNFCRGCITDYCDAWEKVGDLECPVCKAKLQKGNFRSNYQLAGLVEKMKRNLFDARKPNDLCSKHGHEFSEDNENLVCLICNQSPEDRHHSKHNLKEAAHVYKAFGVAGKERVCQEHQEPLKLFCKDDEALICLVCNRSKEHKDHRTLPIGEASQEYKDKFCKCLEILKKERKKIVVCKGDIKKESQYLLEQTKREKQETVAKFWQLHAFLEGQEKLLLAQMTEVEREVEEKRDKHLAELSQQFTFLDSLIQEMEGKCEQPPGDLLQDAKSTLQRYEEKESFENPPAFPLVLKWRIWDFSDLNHLLEGIKKQIKDTMECRRHLQKANVTLDPDTAHPKLILSEGQKRLRQGEKAQALPKNPERFDRLGAVLGREGFTGGRHFWEVLVGSEEGWSVGVARKSLRRKGRFSFSPEEGIWEVGKWVARYGASLKYLNPLLTPSGKLKRIRVCLNYTGGRVAFYDADRAALLYEFSGASFSGETLLPFFYAYEKGHLKISS